MKAANQKTVSNEREVAIQKIVTDESLSKSKKMIAIYLLGVEIKDVAVIMNVRYNFVYNVVSNHCNVTGTKIVTTKKEGKNDLIVAMYLEGKSNKEISIDLKTNYNYVFNTIKQYKIKLEAANITE
jgi:transposase